MAKSFVRGHVVVFSKENGWVFEDTGDSVSTPRECKRCGKLPTKEGHDACIGTLKNITSACCGHGVTDGLML
jgi:hypothetical protein